LTDVSAEGTAIRRPCSFSGLCAITGVDPAELHRVLDVFRARDASFITPYWPWPIVETTPIDISHEALIRSWRRISAKTDGWLWKESRDGAAKAMDIVAGLGKV
jgi:hypothetical protein